MTSLSSLIQFPDPDVYCDKCNGEGKWIDGKCEDEFCFAFKCFICGFIDEDCENV